MNKLFYTFLMLCSTLAIYAQEDVLFTVGDQEVTVSEFKYIFDKNNANDTVDKTEALKEYLELYKKFKLKVQDAKSHQLDTVPALQEELDMYRRQLSKNYLLEKEVKQELYNELFSRMKVDKNISHILIKGKTNKELEAARKKLLAIKDSIQTAEDFKSFAIKYSEDPGVKRNQGNLAYLVSLFPSGFEAMEDVVYQLKAGEVGGPVKSKSGYHLVFLHDSRPAYGVMDVAHILVRAEEDADQIAIEKAKNKIDIAYKDLQRGEPFDQTVQTFSEDASSRMKGGVIGTIKVGLFEKEIEDAIFSLQADGDYTKPIRSRIGWHIFQRVNHFDPKTASKEAAIAFIQKDLDNSDRLDRAQKELIEEIKAEANFELKNTVYQTFKQSNLKDLSNYKWKPAMIENDPVLLTFGNNQTRTISDFSNFLKRNSRERQRRNQRMDNAAIMDELLELYLDEVAIEYEKKNLESKYVEFKNLMREYEEGILLFEITKQKIWDRAPKDSLGLKAFYEKNKNKYKWGKRAEIYDVQIKTEDKKLREKISEKLQAGNIQKLIKKYNKKQTVITYTKNINPISSIQESSFKANEGWKYGIEDQEEMRSLKLVNRVIPVSTKTLQEAKGFVISDYQEQLEKEWISSLENKYDIDVNKKVFKDLLAEYQ